MLVASQPDAFTDPAAEYEALTHAAGLIDLPRAGVLRLRGADRVRFLNAMVTHDVASLVPGAALEALMTTTKGRIVAELLILARPEELLVLVLQGPTARVAEALESHIVADDVTLEDASHDFAALSVEGPKCRELVWRIFPRQPLPLEPLKFTENDYQGMKATVVRHSVVGDKGLHVIVPREHFDLVRSYLVQGALGLDAAVVGRAAWNMRRVENGRPWFGEDADVTEDNFPAEARLESHVSYEKGCFLGQEPLARMHYRGHPNWLLVGLAGGDEVPGPGTELFAASGPADKAAGRVTSAVLSPALRRALCLGYVRAPLAQPDARFQARVAGAAVTFSVVDLPLKGDPKHA
jgi:folate-binding protein YgfZ